MLAYLEHLDLPLEQLQILDAEILLFYNFDGDLLFGAFMDTLFNNTVLTFAKCIPYVIEIVQVIVTNCVFNRFCPFSFFLFRLKVINASFIGEDQHERPHYSTGLVWMLRLILNEDS